MKKLYPQREHCHFKRDWIGILSSIITLHNGDLLEGGSTGRFGALGASVGAVALPSFAAIVRLEGKSSVVDLRTLQIVLDRSPVLRGALARYEAKHQFAKL